MRRNRRLQQPLGGFQKYEILKGEAQRSALPHRSDKTSAHKRPDASRGKIENFRHLAGGEKFHLLADCARFLPFSGSADLARTAGFFSLAVCFPRLSFSAAIKSMTWARCTGGSAMVISLPSAFFCTSSKTRCRYSSS